MDSHIWNFIDQVSIFTPTLLATIAYSIYTVLGDGLLSNGGITLAPCPDPSVMYKHKIKVGHICLDTVLSKRNTKPHLILRQKYIHVRHLLTIL